MRTSTAPDMMIIVTPAGRSRFRIDLGGENLGISDEPLYSTARILMARGENPDLVLGLKHAGSDTLCMTGRIGQLAGWTIVENAKTGPIRARYRAFGDAPGTMLHTVVPARTSPLLPAMMVTHDPR